MTTLAITGGTGFLGGHVLRIAGERGLTVRALARRSQSPLPGVKWIAGALDDAAALDRLTAGADVVLHIAGVVNAPDRAGFVAGNITGTQAVLDAAARARITRIVSVSSLAAREPELSTYGWSKAEADALVRASSLDWTIVRPPAIYGPGDRELLELFRVAARGIVPLPNRGRMSLIAAEDLARLLLDCAGDARSIGQVYEPDDGVEGGWSHRDFAHALGTAVGRRVRTVAMPAALLGIGAWIDGRVRGPRAKLTPDRVAYFLHSDWVVDAAARPPATLWEPRIATPDGLAATAAWYRAEGLL